MVCPAPEECFATTKNILFENGHKTLRWRCCKSLYAFTNLVDTPYELLVASAMLYRNLNGEVVLLFKMVIIGLRCVAYYFCLSTHRFARHTWRRHYHKNNTKQLGTVLVAPVGQATNPLNQMDCRPSQRFPLAATSSALN